MVVQFTPAQQKKKGRASLEKCRKRFLNRWLPHAPQRFVLPARLLRQRDIEQSASFSLLPSTEVDSAANRLPGTAQVDEMSNASLSEL